MPEGTKTAQPPGKAAEAPDSFGSLREVREYLAAQGREVSLSALKRRSGQGLLRQDASFRWTRESVDAVAASILPRGRKAEDAGAQDDAPKARGRRPPAVDLALEKLEREIERLHAQADALERAYARKTARWVEPGEAAVALAHRTAVLSASLRRELRARIPGIVSAVQAEPPAMREEAARRALEDAVLDSLAAASKAGKTAARIGAGREGGKP
jgi:hypothetical protein